MNPFKLFFIFLFLIPLSRVFGLSCVEPSLSDLVAQNAYIVEAKILSGKGGNYEIDIQNWLKGSGEESKAKLEVFTWLENPKFTHGEKYIFFSDEAKTFHASACGFVIKADDKKMLKEIETLLKSGK